MSAVHRVDDICSMQAARFFRLAWRLPHYRGVMRDRVLVLQQEAGDSPGRPVDQAGRPQRAVTSAQQAQAEPVTEAALSDPVMSKIFSFS
jgi:hypothetical protein